MEYMNLKEAKAIAAVGDRAPVGKLIRASDVLLERVLELEREKTEAFERKAKTWPRR